MTKYYKQNISELNPHIYAMKKADKLQKYNFILPFDNKCDLQNWKKVIKYFVISNEK